jgi:nucleoside-diphosphate-sugar epimerase
VLVTGGAGFLGSNLVRRLAADGHDVNVLDDFSRGQRSRLPASGIQIFDGDVRDLDLVKVAMAGCDTVVHMAMVQGTQTFTDSPWRTIEIAMQGTLNVLWAMRDHGVRDMMLLSSSEAYQGERDKIPTDESVWLSVPDILNPRFKYGGGKIAMELMCTAAVDEGFVDRLIVARPHNIYGPDMGHEHVIPEFCDRMKAMIEGSPPHWYVRDFPIQGTGLETRSFCYIDDAVDGMVLLLDQAPEGSSIWHLGTEDERSVEDVAHAVAHCFGRKIAVIPGKLPKGSPPRRCPDISKLRGLGYEPKVSFEDGLARTVEWYKNDH